MEDRIGINIKRIRIQNRMTQQNLADDCGISKGMISKIESGKAMPAVATLTRIAHALGIKVSLLMEEGGMRETVHMTTAFPKDEYVKTEQGYRFSTLAARYMDKQIQPLIFYAKNGEVTPHRVTHQGEECIYIIKGDMDFHVGGITYTLTKGDFLYFDGLQTHGIEYVKDEVCYLGIFSGKEYTSKVFSDKPDA